MSATILRGSDQRTGCIRAIEALGIKQSGHNFREARFGYGSVLRDIDSMESYATGPHGSYIKQSGIGQVVWISAEDRPASRAIRADVLGVSYEWEVKRV